MTSFRSKIIKHSAKGLRLLNEKITPANLAAKRAAYARNKRLFPVAKTTIIRPVHKSYFKGEWIITPQARPNKVMLYFHGGGFVFDSTKMHRDLISRIAAAGHIQAFSLDYSLAPEHPFPAALEEATAAYKWLLGQFQPLDLVLAGDSAGGSIALSLLHVIRDQKLPYPVCAIALGPATDAEAARPRQATDSFIKQENLDFFIDSYFRDTPRNHPVASPLYGDLHGFPPLAYAC